MLPSFSCWIAAVQIEVVSLNARAAPHRFVSMAGACRTCRTVPQTTPQRRLLILCDMRNEARASSYQVETAHDPRTDTDIEEGGGNCDRSIDRDVARKRAVTTCPPQLAGMEMCTSPPVSISRP